MLKGLVEFRTQSQSEATTERFGELDAENNSLVEAIRTDPTNIELSQRLSSVRYQRLLLVGRSHFGMRSLILLGRFVINFPPKRYE